MMKLALGPVLYYWARDTLLDFYQEIAATPVDIVYLGRNRVLPAPQPALAGLAGRGRAAG